MVTAAAFRCLLAGKGEMRAMPGCQLKINTWTYQLFIDRFKQR
jgi:hypothetical protein